jgi:hypothetical protein
MKKIILLTVTTLIMVGCENSVENDTKMVNENYHVIIYDSCEYISGWDLIHKGNCRFCKERRQKEMKELVEQLKDK